MIAENIYMLGIGGIGMSALARYFRSQGCDVAGYDRSATSLTETLQQEGVQIHFIDDPAWVPDEFTPSNTLVIITPAIPDSSKELAHLKQEGYRIVKRSQVLGQLAEDKMLIAVAGTHGKTTTSAIATWLMHTSQLKCHAFVGGVMTNFSSNFVPGGNSMWMVAEADEYDRSFLTLHPRVAVITSTDADHLDVYNTPDTLVRTFAQFANQVKVGGSLIYRYGIKLERPEHVECISYGFEEQADVRICDVTVQDGGYTFSLKGKINLNDIRMDYPGRHNVENATAALLAAWKAGADMEKMVAALAAFRGVKRRFEYVVRTDEHVYIDDYAHHPAELRACILSVKELYPTKKITGIFQPHLYTRTRDFAVEFAEALDLLDDALMIPLYPAREKPIPGVNSELILQKLKGGAREVLSKDEAVAYVMKKRPEVLITMGAGDIDQLVAPIKAVLSGTDEEEE